MKTKSKSPNKGKNEVALIKWSAKIRWPNQLICPLCNNEKTKDGRRATKRLPNKGWHCRCCRKKFTVTTNTKLHSTKLALGTWNSVVRSYFNENQNKRTVNPTTLDKVESDYSTSRKTASRVLKLIREAIETLQARKKFSAAHIRLFDIRTDPMEPNGYQVCLIVELIDGLKPTGRCKMQAIQFLDPNFEIKINKFISVSLVNDAYFWPKDFLFKNRSNLWGGKHFLNKSEQELPGITKIIADVKNSLMNDCSAFRSFKRFSYHLAAWEYMFGNGEADRLSFDNNQEIFEILLS